MVVAVQMHLCNLTLSFAAGQHSDSFHSYIRNLVALQLNFKYSALFNVPSYISCSVKFYMVKQALI